MKHGQIETLKIRLKSIFFVLFTLAVFKPFGIDALQWHTCLYLLAFLIPGGMLVCMLTDAILKYVCRMPHTNKLGVDYIIHRNLLFQFINTPYLPYTILIIYPASSSTSVTSKIRTLIYKPISASCTVTISPKLKS